MGRIQEFCVNARPNRKTHVFLLKINYPCKRVQTHMFSFTNQKNHFKVSKIKSKGLDLVLTEYLRIIFKGWPTGKKSHHQANYPQIGYDGTNLRILCQRAPKLQKYIFLLKIYLSLQKGYNITIYVQLHQQKKGDMKRPRRRCQK